MNSRSDKQGHKDLLEVYPVSEEWLVEIRRRCNEIDIGKVKLLDGDAAIYELREKYTRNG